MAKKPKTMKHAPVLAKTPVVVQAVEEKTFDRIWFNRIAIVVSEIGQESILRVFSTPCTSDGEVLSDQPTMQEVEITGDLANTITQLQEAVRNAL